MYVSVGGELLHYGVKGMKWGVRKERETTGRGGNFGKDSERSGTFGTLRPVDFKKYKPTVYERMIYFNKIHPDLYNAVRIESWYKYWHEHDPDFDTFLDDVRAGSSDRDPNITKAYDVDKALEYMKDIKEKAETIRYDGLSEEELDQFIKYGNELSEIMEYFTGTYQGLKDPEEQEYDDEFEKMVDMIPKSSEIPRGSSITVSGHYYAKDNISGPYWIFKTADGRKNKYEFDQYNKLKSDIELELKKKYDFRKTSAGKRRREKNVVGPPVKVKKSDKPIKITAQERAEKIANSSKGQKQVTDFVNATLDALKIQKSWRENKFKVNVDPVGRLPSIASKRKTSTVSSEKKEVEKLENDGRNWLEKLLNVKDKSK